MGHKKTRMLNGKRYTYGGFLSLHKEKAQRKARAMRKKGWNVRIFLERGQWVYYYQWKG